MTKGACLIGPSGEPVVDQQVEVYLPGMMVRKCRVTCEGSLPKSLLQIVGSNGGATSPSNR